MAQPYSNAIQATPQPNAPVNVALTTALEQLFRCDSLVTTIRARIYDNEPSVQGLEKEYTPGAASALSNTLSTRLATLGDRLEEIASSF